MRYGILEVKLSMAVVYGSELKDLIATEDVRDIFLKTMVEYVRSRINKNTLQIIESNRVIAAEALMQISPDSLRDYVTKVIVADYESTLFDNYLVKQSWRPISLAATTLAECFFDPIQE